MPGARVRRMPTMISMAPAIADISMKPMPSSQKSALSPGEYWELVERRIHEPAAIRRQVEKQRAEEKQPADEIGPEGKGAEARETAGRARASICGRSRTPIASTTGTANRNIITVPCMVKSWL